MSVCIYIKKMVVSDLMACFLWTTFDSSSARSCRKNVMLHIIETQWAVRCQLQNTRLVQKFKPNLQPGQNVGRHCIVLTFFVYDLTLMSGVGEVKPMTTVQDWVKTFVSVTPLDILKETVGHLKKKKDVFDYMLGHLQLCSLQQNRVF